jgi:HSP20 family protein
VHCRRIAASAVNAPATRLAQLHIDADQTSSTIDLNSGVATTNIRPWPCMVRGPNIQEYAMSALTSRASHPLLDDFFRDFAPGFFVRPLHGEPLPSPAQIKIDVKEAEAAYTVLAEVPGARKEDLHVSVDGGTVTLQAEVRQQDQQAPEGKVLRSERYYGSVARSFQLPQDVDASQAKAKYDNGVLTLTLPKKANASVQRLNVE